ncbi:hypothetical protein PO909_018809 [Leuciscus waleckii]
MAADVGSMFQYWKKFDLRRLQTDRSGYIHIEVIQTLNLFMDRESKHVFTESSSGQISDGYCLDCAQNMSTRVMNQNAVHMSVQKSICHYESAGKSGFDNRTSTEHLAVSDDVFAGVCGLWLSLWLLSNYIISYSSSCIAINPQSDRTCPRKNERRVLLTSYKRDDTEIDGLQVLVTLVSTGLRSHGRCRGNNSHQPDGISMGAHGKDRPKGPR